MNADGINLAILYAFHALCDFLGANNLLFDAVQQGFKD